MGCLWDVAWKISYGPRDDRLREFYIPALSRSVSYLRTAGFFSSHALAIAAAGVAHLVRNGGRMRLLVGARLSEEDVRAIERGEEEFGRVLEERLLEALAELERDPDDRLRRRLQVLSWMVAQGTLQIKVVLPVGPDGRPLPATDSAPYFHAKEGVFTDGCGHRVAFSGSVNETAQGWLRNYEEFMVYTSWDASRTYLMHVVERTERLWQDEEEGWRAFPVPEAVRRRLLQYAPDRSPERDPQEEPWPPVPLRVPRDQAERILFRFLRDVSTLPGGERVGMRTAALVPWPHQARIVHEVVSRFSERFLLADEVGLGKTIEAGLVLRSLLLSRRAHRCLILVPKSVLRQWQEELYEKFALNVPCYDGTGFVDYFGAVPAPAGNPWNAFPVLLASSQLAKRRDRAPELLGADPWDLVIVDEAHHARRRDFRVPRYRPNRLLALLEGNGTLPGLADRTRGLLLLSATPMQIHPVELYDLLRQLDLPGVWAAAEDRFLDFSRQMLAARKGEPADWEFLLRLARASAPDLVPEQLVGEAGRRRVNAVEWQRIEDIFAGRRGAREAHALSPEGRAVLLEMCRRASPLGRKMFRTTREQLRRYYVQGLLADPVPERVPQPQRIRMSPEEWDLHQRLEDYMSNYYAKYEQERRGLGFVMTVYRRRLTSSFAALGRSLERRREYLIHHQGPLFGLVDEDFEDEELREDRGEQLEAHVAAVDKQRLQQLFREELSELNRLLEAVQRLSQDSKFRYLVDDLTRLLGLREQVAVFTHYTDTLDYLRERLVGVYGRQLACYSGRAGERWDGRAWVPCSKEEVKEAFRRGEIRVLLCTEAASEGLNLQTCGVLVNYDMPWNPMRVEQRIGRFDRIGQRHREVRIHHYFLVGPNGEDTVEARVYEVLGARIGWFRSVVGELQPILHASTIIEQASMAPRDRRGEVLDRLVSELQREIEAAVNQSVPLEELAAEPGAPPEGPVPLTLQDLERVLMTSSLRERFRPHTSVPGGLYLDLSGRQWEVTFNPQVADAHPGRIRLLTLGEPLLEELLDLVQPPLQTDSGRGILRASADGVTRWYAVRDGRLTPIGTLADLRAALEGGVEEVTHSHLELAEREVREAAMERNRHMAELSRRREEEHRKALEERGRLLLALATACQQVLLDTALFEPAWRAVQALRFPFAPLARLAGSPDEEEVRRLRGRISDAEAARRQLEGLRRDAEELVRRLAQADPSRSAVQGHPLSTEVAVLPVDG